MQLGQCISLSVTILVTKITNSYNSANYGWISNFKVSTETLTFYLGLPFPNFQKQTNKQIYKMIKTPIRTTKIKKL